MIGCAKCVSLIGWNLEKLSISSELTRNPGKNFTTGASSFGVTKYVS